MRLTQKRAERQGQTIGAVMRDCYGYAYIDERLRLSVPLCYVFGELRLSRTEIATSLTDEREFVALVSARLDVVLDDMIAELEACCTETWPVHDDPA